MGVEDLFLGGQCLSLLFLGGARPLRCRQRPRPRHLRVPQGSRARWISLSSWLGVSRTLALGVGVRGIRLRHRWSRLREHFRVGAPGAPPCSIRAWHLRRRTSGEPPATGWRSSAWVRPCRRRVSPAAPSLGAMPRPTGTTPCPSRSVVPRMPPLRTNNGLVFENDLRALATSTASPACRAACRPRTPARWVRAADPRMELLQLVRGPLDEGVLLHAVLTPGCLDVERSSCRSRTVRPRYSVMSTASASVNFSRTSSTTATLSGLGSPSDSFPWLPEVRHPPSRTPPQPAPSSPAVAAGPPPSEPGGSPCNVLVIGPSLAPSIPTRRPRRRARA